MGRGRGPLAGESELPPDHAPGDESGKKKKDPKEPAVNKPAVPKRIVSIIPAEKTRVDKKPRDRRR
jgi:hypothetical protein